MFVVCLRQPTKPLAESGKGLKKSISAKGSSQLKFHQMKFCLIKYLAKKKVHNKRCGKQIMANSCFN